MESQPTVQSQGFFEPSTCTVHLLRHSLDFVAWKDRKSVATALKDIYRAVDAEAGNTRRSSSPGSVPGKRSFRSMPFPPKSEN
ncbi:hypothetical protein HC62_00230 [Acetobacter tropicalis]|uniref:Transposase n=1 Tax=Acetobacter tropicalis TaxID=104102 RepID=A0A251ZYR1_9PROT|nr:hypothetical protein HC62_00230 [Acetobacter tropicalis]